MADCEKEEAHNLQMEFEWVLHEEVHSSLSQLRNILMECAQRFPLALFGNDQHNKTDRFVFAAPHDQVKCVAVLTGDSITNAEVNFKVQRQQNINMRTSIQNEHPWKLQQIQDAANHLQQAIAHIDNVDRHYLFKTSDEVMHVLGNILGCLQRSRTSLIVPRKKTIDDLIKSRNMKSLNPNLPENLAISFYIQSYKLVLAVYQLENAHGSVKYETQQAECSVPWLNDALVLLTIALQLCQRLKDKICVFSQYKDFTVSNHVPSTVSW
ncbi:rogdi atypical leucine zipper isoform X1 [Osmia lignaria lignaria]|uniref:protein rogdi isoform X1 n=2 Tax=Osmia TaxID=124287 RepID=UPI0010F5A64C|nr:protein rogdi isoform X1 [Osmia bicornis bicornis]XP_034189045.1 protein rogdi isoform X1 [Osmia lignaria]